VEKRGWRSVLKSPRKKISRMRMNLLPRSRKSQQGAVIRGANSALEREHRTGFSGLREFEHVGPVAALSSY
jgi:hypothetical protein